LQSGLPDQLPMSLLPPSTVVGHWGSSDPRASSPVFLLLISLQRVQGLPRSNELDVGDGHNSRKMVALRREPWFHGRVRPNEIYGVG
jgi:hypothetical protein